MMKKRFISMMLMLAMLASSITAMAQEDTDATIFDDFIPAAAVPGQIKTVEEPTLDADNNVNVKGITFFSRNDGTDNGVNVYAKVIYPQDADTEVKYPGILMLHGGAQDSSKTYTKYAYKMAAKGYAVIVPEIPGIANPANPGISSYSTGKWKSENYESRMLLSEGDSVTDCVLYDAVIASLQSFHILQDGKVFGDLKIDTDNLGISGLSWGGYMTTMLSGLLGNQVRASLSLFGCGYYDYAQWQTKLNALPEDVKNAWLENYDAGRQAKNITASIFFAAASNDAYFYPEAVKRTFNAIPDTTPKYMVYAPNSNHNIKIPYGDGNDFHQLGTWEGTLLNEPFFEYELKGSTTYKGAMPKVEITDVSRNAKGGYTIDFKTDNYVGTDYENYLKYKNGDSSISAPYRGAVEVYYSYKKDSDGNDIPSTDRTWVKKDIDSYDFTAKTGKFSIDADILSSGQVDYYLLAYELGGYKLGSSFIYGSDENDVVYDINVSGDTVIPATGYRTPSASAYIGSSANRIPQTADGTVKFDEQADGTLGVKFEKSNWLIYDINIGETGIYKVSIEAKDAVLSASTADTTKNMKIYFDGTWDLYAYLSDCTGDAYKYTWTGTLDSCVTSHTYNITTGLYLNKGKHTIMIEADTGAFTLGNIKLTRNTFAQQYEEPGEGLEERIHIGASLYSSFNEGTPTVCKDNYANLNGDNVEFIKARDSYAIFMDPNEWYEYEFETEKEGWYNIIDTHTAGYYGNDIKATITVNGVDYPYVLKSEERDWANIFRQTVGSVYLKQGKNTVRFTQTAQTSYMYSIDFVMPKTELYYGDSRIIGKDDSGFVLADKTHITSGQITAKVNLQKISDGKDNVIVLALFDGEKLVDMKMIANNKTAAETTKKYSYNGATHAVCKEVGFNNESSVTLDITNVENAQIKAFLWNSIDGAEPVLYSTVY